MVFSGNTEATSSNAKSRRFIAISLTAAYWIATFPLTLAAVRRVPSFFLAEWLYVSLYFAVPVTVLVWVIALTDKHFQELQLSKQGFIAIGIALPILYILAFDTYPNWRNSRLGLRRIEQSVAAILESTIDEPLIGAHGPIGIRLRYLVRYPRGLDMASEVAPTAFMYTNVGIHNTMIFRNATKIVSPSVSGSYPQGLYTITEDFIPEFMPPMLSAYTGTRSGSVPAPANKCFRWSNNLTRPDIERAEPQVIYVWIYPGLPAGNPITSKTRRTYRMSEFLETAIQEGAVECTR